MLWCLYQILSSLLVIFQKPSVKARPVHIYGFPRSCWRVSEVFIEGGGQCRLEALLPVGLTRHHQGWGSIGDLMSCIRKSQGGDIQGRLLVGDFQRVVVDMRKGGDVDTCAAKTWDNSQRFFQIPAATPTPSQFLCVGQDIRVPWFKLLFHASMFKFKLN